MLEGGLDDDNDNDDNCPELCSFYVPRSFACFISLNPDNHPMQ